MIPRQEMSSGTLLAEAFLAETKQALDQEYRRIRHSLDQLGEEEIWRRPSAEVNSPGILVRHLCGNLRQWLLHGLGGTPDVRDRPSEFEDTRQPRRDILLAELSEILESGKDLLDALNAARLLERVRIQGFETNLLAAVYSTVTHLEGHALQIAYITHLCRGQAYEPFWKPANPEQGGAPATDTSPKAV